MRTVIEGGRRLAGWFSGAAPVTPHQFALFRWLFGLYLAWQCASLVPRGPGPFSRAGVDPAVDRLHGLFPNPLADWDAPWAVTGWLMALTALSLLFAAGVARRTAAVALWIGLACLLGRNDLIANPSLPYVGAMLLLTALVPPGEGWSLRRWAAAEGWSFPASVFHVGWILLAAGYTYSGLVKLASPSWVDASALAHLFDNPLARPGPLPSLATWVALAVEILAVPLALYRRTRPWWWLAAVLLQLGFLSLTAGMLLAHLFTFDRRWLPGRRPVPGARHLVLYDGVCGLCNRLVQFLLAEDRDGVLSYAPLQGPTARAALERMGLGELAASGGGEETGTEGGAEPGAPGTMVFLRDQGSDRERAHLRSDGVLATLDTLGGIWRPASWLRILPRPLRDAAYRWVATNRYRWFGRYDVCKLPPPEARDRLLG